MSSEDKEPKKCGCMGPCGQSCEYADWRERQENKTPHNFCETSEEKCTMNYCDENGCQNRKRRLVEENKQLPTACEVIDKFGCKVDDSNVFLAMEEYKDLHTAPLREELEKLRAENKSLTKGVIAYRELVDKSRVENEVLKRLLTDARNSRDLYRDENERLRKELRENEGATLRYKEYAEKKRLENQKLRDALEGLYNYTKNHRDLKGYIKFEYLLGKAKEALKGGSDE